MSALLARLRARLARPFSHRVGLSAVAASLLLTLAEPDAQAALQWALSVVGVTRWAHWVPLLTRLVAGITVFAAWYSHPKRQPAP